MSFLPPNRTLPAILIAVLPLAAFAQERTAPEAVAVVTSITGNVTLTAQADKKSPVHLFDWLPAGAVIESAAGSRVTLVFADGHRYEVAEKSRVSLGPAGPKSAAGSVRPLEAVPPMPRLVAISASRAGALSGAIRLRQGSNLHFRNLYPSGSSVTLPDSTVLHFAPIEGASRYRVELEDESGKTVFDAETPLSAVMVPAGILRPGSHYYWKVRTIESLGPSVRGESDFATLEEEDIHRRAAVRAALEKKNDVESLALMAEIDRRLELLMEAREGFQTALTKAPDDAALQKAIAEIDAQLSSDPANP
jgi:hypothetical protein